MRITKRYDCEDLVNYTMPYEKRHQVNKEIDALITALLISEGLGHTYVFPALALREIAQTVEISYCEVKEYFIYKCLRRATYAAMVKY